LMAGSGVLAGVCVLCLLEGAPLQRVQWLTWFLAAQLIWHALRTRKLIFAALLFFLVWIALLAATSPGVGALLSRVTPEQSISPTLWLLITIQLIFVALERLPSSAADPNGADSQPDDGGRSA